MAVARTHDGVTAPASSGAVRRPAYRLRQAIAGVSLEMRLALRRGTERVRPSIFVIGVQKSGTTSLFGHLARHPQIVPPLVKEVHYFDVATHRGEGWYAAHFPTLGEVAAAADKTGAPVHSFDTTPYYIFHPEVTARILAYAPDAKIIAVLRDPVARAWSHYWHEWARGFETLEPEAAFAAEARRLPDPHHSVGRTAAEAHAHQHFSYVARSEYDRQLERWMAQVPPRRLLCVKSERLFTDPAGSLGQVADFLGIAPFASAPDRALNTGRYDQPPAGAEAWLRDRLSASMAATSRLLGPEFTWP